MSVPNLSGIESMLQQMRAVVRTSSGADTTVGAGQAVEGGFAAELQRSIRRVSETQQAAATQAKAFEMGEPGIALNDVMIDLQKASLAFQGAVQVRNRLVAAYQEVASMAV